MIGALIAKMKVSSVFDALNKRDLPAFLSTCRDDCVFIYPGEVPASGKYEGKPAIEKWFQYFLDQFPKLRFTIENTCVENIFDFVGTNVVIVHWSLDATSRDGVEIQNSGITVLTIKFGKALHVKDFSFESGEVFKAAWGENQAFNHIKQ